MSSAQMPGESPSCCPPAVGGKTGSGDNRFGH